MLTSVLAQVGTFTEAKDWVLVLLVGLVGALIGGAWADIKSKIRALETRLDTKIAEDTHGYERLTRVEEQVAALRRKEPKE